LVRAALMAEPGSLNAKGQGGQTPLMNAVLQGKATSVKILLEAGADVRIPEQDGYTPMVIIRLLQLFNLIFNIARGRISRSS
jgi:ankyrin repeat protein